MNNIKKYTFLEIYREFVEKYEKNNIRHKLFKNLKDFIGEMCNILIPDYMWIGGSFVTDKELPNDIDVVFFFEVEQVEEKKDILKVLVENLSKIFKIHGHIAWSDLHIEKLTPENKKIVDDRKKYWEETFSNNKGIIDNRKIIVQVSKDEIINNCINNN
jgi:hypothetical protein